MRKFTQLLTFLSLVLCTTVAHSSGLDLGQLGSNNGGFLPVEEAYKASVTTGQEHILLDWTIAPGYYLYRDKFKVSAKIADQTQPLSPQLEEGLVKYDEYEEKEVGVFYNSTRITIPLGDLPKEFLLNVRSQGCADAGLCYAPRTQAVQINRDLSTAGEVAPTAGPPTPLTGTGDSPTTLASGGASYGLYLLLALLGGMVLNLMPCV